MVKKIIVVLLAMAMVGLTASTALGANRPSIARMSAKSQQRAARICLESERIDPILNWKWMRCVEEFNRVDGCYNGTPLTNGYGYCNVHMEFIISRFQDDPNAYLWRCTTIMQYRQVGTNLYQYRIKDWFCSKVVS